MTRVNGFTLIELLVAMTAGALLLASISWAVARLGRGLEHEKRDLQVRRLLAVSESLTALASTARAASAGDILQSDKRLSFIGQAPLSAGPVGLVHADIEVKGRSGNESLTLQFSDVNGRVLDMVPSSTLLSGQRRILFGWANGAGEASRLIEVRVTANDGERHDIRLPIRINGDASCQFDPISMACR